MSIHNNLEQYLASVKTVPVELKKHMQLIRALDAKQQALYAQLRREQGEFVADARAKTDNGEEVDEEQLSTLKEQYRTILTLCDKKVHLASEAYQLLDESIRKLDADLRKFETELEQKELNLTAAERRKRKASSGIGPAEQRRLFASSAADPFPRGSERKRVAGLGGVARAFDVALDMPIDPNEPTYCLCQRVSFGEMVGCDNPECRREWFHFECVGLSANPKGKWLCPECSAAQRRQMGANAQV